MKTRVTGWWLVSMFLAIGLVACNGDDEGDPCEGLIDSCASAGASRCDSDNLVVEACEENADGCPVWVEDQDCGASDEVCGLVSGQAVCQAACTDGCSTEGATQCSGSVIQTCSEGMDGCLDWADGDDCADDGQVCDDSGDSAVCACTDLCSPQDATQCRTTVIQTCSPDASGCLDWVDGDDCDDTGQACDDSGDAAVCACADACSPEDATQCAGSVIQTCTAGADGCLAWADGDDCADTGETCDDSGAVAVCSCTDSCQPADATQCNGNVIQTCSAGAGGCLEWTDGIDCMANGDLCDDSGDTAVCICTDECQTENATQCTGTVIQTCTTGADGCLDWADGTDCADAGDVCDDSADPAVCVCTDLCPAEDDTQCSGTVIQTCSIDGDGCLDWVDGVDCLDSEMICNMVSGDAACEAAPCSESVADGSFEVGTPSTDWAEASTAFGTPICDEANCGTGGTDGPLTGTFWAWFGGVEDAFEEGSLSQDVALLPNSAILSFFFMVPANSGDTDDTFEVSLDDTPVFTLTAGPDADAYPDWTQVILDLNAYADGGVHTLKFYAVTNGVAGTTNFFVDDVSFLSGTDCCISECATENNTRCDGWSLQTCTLDTLGCLVWEDTTDCAGLQQECVVIDPDNAHCVDCTDECPALDDQRCQDDWIQTCIAGPDTCLDWSDTEDCHALPGWCDDSGADPVCASYGSMVPGTDCDDVNIVPLDIPAGIPAVDFDQTNCGAEDDYNSTCMGSYDGGEDVVYALNVTETSIVGFAFDPLGTAYTGVGLGPTCPLEADCTLVETEGGSTPFQTDCVSLETGTHYLMVDTFPSPDCIPAFDLMVYPCDCATGDAVCADVDTLSECDQTGTWVDRPCLNGCAELSPGVFDCQPDPGDDCSDVLVIPSLPFVYNGGIIDNFSNRVSMLNSDCTGYATGGKDVIFELTLAADTDLDLVVDGDYDMGLYVTDQCGADLPDAACMAGADTSGGEEISVSLPAGTYFVIVDYWLADGPATGTFNLTVAVQ